MVAIPHLGPPNVASTKESQQVKASGSFSISNPRNSNEAACITCVDVTSLPSRADSNRKRRRLSRSSSKGSAADFFSNRTTRVVHPSIPPAAGAYKFGLQHDVGVEETASLGHKDMLPCVYIGNGGRPLALSTGTGFYTRIRKGAKDAYEDGSLSAAGTKVAAEQFIKTPHEPILRLVSPRLLNGIAEASPITRCAPDHLDPEVQNRESGQNECNRRKEDRITDVSCHSPVGNDIFLRQPAKDITHCSKLIVFQSEPLVWKWEDNERDKNELETIDLGAERKVLEESLVKTEAGGVKLVLDCKYGTTKSLCEFLASSSSEALHFSCHGCPGGSLLFENDRGGAHFISPDQLNELFDTVPKEKLPRFVFVAACESVLAGEALIKAGVPHVLCCKKRTAATIEFSGPFYRALAEGRTLMQAFKLGRKAVKLSSSLKNPEEEMDNFVLLPNNNDDQGMHSSHHNVKIFFEKHQRILLPTSSPGLPLYAHPLTHLPYPPLVFHGRRADMHTLIEKATRAQLTRLRGPEGYGKRTLAKSVAHYIAPREHSFSIQSVLWLPFQRSFQRDRLSEVLEELCAILRSENQSRYSLLRDEAFELLQGRQVLFVVDPETFSSSSLALFLDDIFERLNHARVIIICREGFDIELRQNLQEEEFELGPLDFKRSAVLFGKLCRHVDKSSPSTEFAKHVVPEEEEEVIRPTSNKGCRVWDAIGRGIPADIHKAAKDMTETEFKKLIQFDQPASHILPNAHDILCGATNGRTANVKSSELAKETKQLYHNSSESVEPHAHDVLFGEGDSTNNHAGNVKFIDLVNKKKQLYRESSRPRKNVVLSSIVETVWGQNPPGRFLSKRDETGLWFVMSDKMARKKTFRALMAEEGAQ